MMVSIEKYHDCFVSTIIMHILLIISYDKLIIQDISKLRTLSDKTLNMITLEKFAYHLSAF